MASPAAASARALSPMLCATASEPPRGDGWTFEPKYDGIRVLAYATPASASLITRNGNDKARQFPDIAAGLRALADVAGPLVLDGEIVALHEGEIARFGRLQGRMHVRDAARIRTHARERPAAFIAFDILMRRDESLVREPWEARRRRLEETLAHDADGTVLLGETTPEGEELLLRGREEDWEGIIAKKVDAPYRPGRRSRDWLKIKLDNVQEFVVGGWTEPRGSRSLIGALLLGYYDADGELEYAGHTGTGFDRASLADMHRRLKRLERKTPPFRHRPSTNQTPHWVTPRVVVQVRFNEWTHHGTLRQPVFVGIREDKDPKEVVRETGAAASAGRSPESGAKGADAGTGEGSPPRSRSSKPRGRGRGRSGGSQEPGAEVQAVLDRLTELEKTRAAGGEVPLPGGGVLPVTSLNKVFFPRTGHTKGDLLRYYARMWSVIRPWIADRALVLKRYPNGVDGKAFYQQTAPEQAPDGVRVEYLVDEAGDEQARFVGGGLATLLYTVQLGAISYDPWHSRFHALGSADYTIIDLDPGPGAPFATVIQVARRVREEMDALGLHGALKTSGSSGLHVHLPLPGGTPLEAATLVAQIVATRVAKKYPEIATIERMTRNRPGGTIYVDYLQNILGKTVAGVYAVRARELATVSTPLRWSELTDELDPTAFTIDTVPPRVAEMGDLWAEEMAEPVSLERLTGAA